MIRARNPIDKNFESLEQKLVQYKGLINLDINKVSDNFRRNVFRILLTNEADENIPKTLKEDINTNEIEQALKNLGLTEKSEKNN